MATLCLEQALIEQIREAEERSGLSRIELLFELGCDSDFMYVSLYNDVFDWSKKHSIKGCEYDDINMMMDDAETVLKGEGVGYEDSQEEV